MRELPPTRKQTEPSMAGQRNVPASPIVFRSARVSLFRTYKSTSGRMNAHAKSGSFDHGCISSAQALQLHQPNTLRGMLGLQSFGGGWREMGVVLTSSPSKHIDWFAQTTLKGGSSTVRRSVADALLRTTRGSEELARTCNNDMLASLVSSRSDHLLRTRKRAHVRKCSHSHVCTRPSVHTHARNATYARKQ
jgi:hypothetical protein